MPNVRLLLNAKGKDIWFIAPDVLVYDALQMMAEKNVGALPVVEGDKVVGIFSERDYARKVVLHGKSSKSSPVREMMTSRIYCISPDDSIDTCMQIMTNSKIRHLPVVEGKKLVGIVSIGDVVKKVISDHEFTIQELEKYIMS
ncbi:MAG: CBS domain-containing protein [Candidatus Eisenbacteria bacterium]